MGVANWIFCSEVRLLHIAFFNNKQVVITSKFGYPLFLKQGAKVKSEHIRRFLPHDFLQFGSVSNC